MFLGKKKTRYEELGIAEKLDSIRGWALHGGKKAVAQHLGIAQSTLAAWIGRYPDLAEAVKKGVDESNGELLTSAFDMARGYERDVQEVVKVKIQRIDPETGKILTEERAELVELKRFFPPDPRMNQFLLANRLRADYRKSPEPEQSADDKVVRLVFEGTEGEDFAG